MNQKPTPSKQSPALYIGIDWADQAHDGYIIDAEGNGQPCRFKQTPEAIEQWVAELKERAGDRPVAIMLEQSKGPLIYALMHRPGILLYPINPKQFARYRESYPGGNSKSDPSDARYIARMLRERIAMLRPWIADDEPTRKLAILSEQRRKIVNDQVALRQQLIAHLKSYFPLLLELFDSTTQLKVMLQIIGRWSDPRALKRADRQLVDRVRQKSDDSVVVVGAVDGERCQLLVGVSKGLVGRVKAGDVVRQIAPVIGGGGGGRPDLAQAGGKDPTKLDEAIEAAKALVLKTLG